MAQVTYRGVKYNTNDKSKKSCQENATSLVYRGMEHEKKVPVCA